jgi:septal ring factor EnvC (AmiA/AmiB activator)
MVDKLISPIENFLPGALSKWILVSSIALSGFLLLIPSYDLPAKYTTDKDLIALMLRLLSAMLPLLIGSVSLITLLVRHNRKIQVDLSNAKSETESFANKNSNIITDKNTLQSRVDEYKQVIYSLRKDLASSQESLPKLKNINDDLEFKLKMANKLVSVLKEDLNRHKKYLKQYAPAGFDIVREEEYEKGWNEADKKQDK